MRSFITAIFLLLLFSVGFVSCNTPHTKGDNTAVATAAEAAGHNFLTMKVNGVAWEADHEIMAIFHPKGYNNAILISGYKGPKDKSEQTFNLNLYNANGEGSYEIVSGNKDNNEVQLANLSNEHYLYGNVLGFSFNAQITKAANNPSELQARFEGVLIGNTGDSVKITEGKFYYHE